MLTKLLPKVSVFSNHKTLDVILISRLRNVHASTTQSSPHIFNNTEVCQLALSRKSNRAAATAHRLGGHQSGGASISLITEGDTASSLLLTDQASRLSPRQALSCLSNIPGGISFQPLDGIFSELGALSPGFHQKAPISLEIGGRREREI